MSADPSLPLAAASGAPPGVYVLGMHRSGTSVLAGVLDLLGLDAGDRSDLLAGDQFNSDGYFERRSVVDWHDAALRQIKGWASAPPPPTMLGDRRLNRLVEDIEPLLRGYRSTWFLKDPRQCLFLPTWYKARGNRDLSIVVMRDPTDVRKSLITRNRYGADLATAVWERYTYDLLRGLRGRQALVLDYGDLTSNPSTAIEQILDILDDHVPGGVSALKPDIDAAINLIRIRPRHQATDEGWLPEQRQLQNQLKDLKGRHQAVSIGPIGLSGRSSGLLARRRRRLNSSGMLIRANMDLKARLDRIPLFRG